MAERIERQALVPPVLALKRFDQAAAELFPEFSRSRLQAWIKTGELSVDGKTMKPREKLKGGESLRLNALVQDQVSGPENIDLEIVHEDASLLVINKPAGMIVHPGAGNAEGTLMNALLYHDERLATLPRAGIVHRLDKETTGLLVVARTLAAHHHLGRQFSDKTAGRVYEAIVYGRVNRHGRIEAAIGRHPVYRTRMGVRADGRLAVTHYDIVKCFDGHTHLRLNLETGRTHQIRVHLQHIRHPIVG
ncbi:MAG: RluA family pseudouridine synthase, partial [Gammaproteobacteria bacterium]|nr:RluA family pseudouridine synthase [Gammaproteobacteria bacterium]